MILGNCVTVMSSMIGEATIGDFATTTGFSNIAGAILGKRVFVGRSCDSKWKNNR